MKKIVLGLVGIVIIAGAIFFFNSKNIVAQNIDEQITALQTHGFVIEDRTKNQEGEHFVISLADMQKFSKLVPQYEKVLLAEDKSALIEFKLGVDITSSGAVVSADIYPVAFPIKGLSSEEKSMIDKYIKEKTLLLKVNYNGVTEGFDGSLKDIDEQIKDVGLKLTGLNFDGTFGDKIVLKYLLKSFSVIDSKSQKPVVEVQGFTSDITYEGSNYYISNGIATIDNILMGFEDKFANAKFSDIKIELNSDIDNDLLNSRIKIITKELKATFQNEQYLIDTFTLDYGMKNIDLEAFEKLAKVLDQENPNFKSPEVEKNIQKILANGIILDIHKFGIEDINLNGESLKGFSIKTQVKLDKDPDIVQKFQKSPQSALSAINVESKIEISDEIFAQLMKNPKAMMLMLMMIEPKEENGYKIYEISMKENALIINDKPMM